MSRRIFAIAAAALTAFLLIPSGAGAAAALPRLLWEGPASGAFNFRVRPGDLNYDIGTYVKHGGGNPSDYYLGAGTTAAQFGTKAEPRIHWITWGITATADATLATPECSSLKGVLQSCSGHYLLTQVKLKASRAVAGHYTRFQVTLPALKGLGPTVLPYTLRTIEVKSPFSSARLKTMAWCLEKASGCVQP